MNSSEAAESVVKVYLEGVEVGVRIVGPAAKELAVMFYAILKDNKKIAGSTNLRNMLKSGKELKVFSLKEKDLKTFQREAKNYGILYSVLKKKNQKSEDGIVDILVRSEDAAKINRIVEKFKLMTHDKAEILSSIEKDREAKNKGVKEKSPSVKEKEDIITKPSKKGDNSLDPYLAKTEKSPLFEQNLENKNISVKGTDKTSVKKELDEIKEEIKSKSGKKAEIKAPIKSKKKKRKSKSR